MHKIGIIFIAFSLMVLSSCSVIKKQAKSGESESDIKSSKFLKEVSGNNLTNSGFRFDRVRVIMTEGGETRRFTANIRYSNEEKFLISVRIISAIELLRIYVDENNIIILDRINRSYLSGATKDVLGKYGMNWNDFPLMFGDLPVTSTSKDKIKCINGKANMALNTLNGNYQVVFDCSMKKLIRVEGASSQYSINMDFKDFSSTREALFPSNSVFKENKTNTRLEFNFSGYSGYNGTIEIPEKPTKYDRGKL